MWNKLVLNSTKTEFMLSGSRQKLSTLSESVELPVDNNYSCQTSIHYYVPLEYSLVDENLTWHSQINKLTQKIASGNGAMKRIRPFVPPATLHRIVNALV